jgi:flavin reductase (DIM6/NTAB) family NADH-FMN oxidoreductase RutF
MKKSIGAKPLVFSTPVWVIGTYDQSGKPNLLTASWGGMCCSKPPCVAVSLRSATYSHGSIMTRRAFTINVPSESHAAQADYIGMVSGQEKDKFAAAGLSAAKSDVVDAPYVREFPLVLECRVVHVVEIGLHTLFVGEIADIKADQAVLGADGLPDLEKVKPLVYDPSHSRYFAVGRFLGHAFSLGESIQKT